MENAYIELPRLLSDHPEKKDAFGAHSAIARALAELILKDNEGRCIALQGSWGSGKSTVLSMLTGYLAGEAEIFVFDTWSNQGDPLRFSFMGSFASWCQKFPGLQIEAKKWKKEVDDTARQATREFPEETRPKSILSQWLTALLLVALPVGLALSSDQWSKLFGEEAASIIYVVGFLLVLSPLIFLAILWRFYGLNLFSEIVEAIERTAEGAKRIIVRKGPLATSLDFSRKINKYCNALYEENKERKLLIVFDNIDRVAEQNSAKVWSLLTALLEAVHDKGAAFKSNIWVLVPVDLDSIPIPVSARSAPAKTAIGSNQNHASVNPDVLKLEFIEKTFQLNIVVPAPLSVATERYFESQYKAAFGNTPVASDWYECYSALRAARASSQPLTPRAIKRFINDLVGLWRSRHEIDSENMPSIAIMALYLCSRGKIHHPDDVASVFQEEALALQIQDENPIAALAAVAFGSKVKDGLQILVSARIDAALEAESSDSFGDLAEIDGFAPAFAKAVHDHRAWLEADNAMMARVYEQVGQFDANIQAEIARRIRQTTSSLVGAGVITGQIDGRVARGLARAHVFARSDEGRLQLGLQRLLDSANASLQGKGDLGPIWCVCVESFVQALLDCGAQFTRIELNLPNNDTSAMQILHWNIRKISFGGKVKFKASDGVVKQLEQKLIQSAAAATLSEEDVVVSQTLREISTEFSGVQLCSAMQQRFLNATGFRADSLAAAISIIDDTVRVEKNDACDNQAMGWLRSGFLYHHYNAAQGDKQKLTASLLGLCAGLPLSGNQIGNWNNSAAGRQNFANACNGLSGEALVSTYEYLRDAHRFRDVISRAQALGLLSAGQALLRAMLAEGDDIYTAESYCDELFKASEQYNDDLKIKLADYAVEKLGVDEYLTKLPVIEPNLGVLGYQRIGASIGDDVRRRSFYAHVGELLCLQSFDWWKMAVEGKDQAVHDLANIVTQLVGPGWLGSSDARRAVGDLVIGKSFASDQASGDYLTSLMSALTADERRLVLMQVKNKAVAQRGERTEFERFCKLASFMFADTEIANDINTIVISVLVPAIEADNNNRQLISEMIERYNLFDRTSGEARKRLAAVLKPRESAVE